MKLFKEEIVTKRVAYQVTCNICGQPAVIEESSPNHHSAWSLEMKINWTNHGSFPGQQAGIASADICCKCYEEKIKPLFALPLNEEIHDCDSGATIVKP